MINEQAEIEPDREETVTARGTSLFRALQGCAEAAVAMTSAKRIVYQPALAAVIDCALGHFTVGLLVDTLDEKKREIVGSEFIRGGVDMPKSSPLLESSKSRPGNWIGSCPC